MSNDTLLREVDEELRRERMRTLWRRGGPYIVGAAVAVVLLVAGYEGWNWFSQGNASRSSDQFYAAVTAADGSDVEAARQALDTVIAEGSGAYPVLARFREAALLAENGDRAGALAAYDALATSQSDARLREIALVMAATLLVDDGDVPAVEQRIAGSLAPDSPMRNAAREVLGLTQYRAGALDAAMLTFEAIIDDPLSSQDLASRAQIYVQQLIAEGATPAAIEAEAGADAAAPAEVDADAAATPPEPVSAEGSSDAP